jgi:hypothetical protein
MANDSNAAMWITISIVILSFLLGIGLTGFIVWAIWKLVTHFAG